MTLRPLAILASLVLALAVTADVADARPRPARHRRSKFVANKTFGLGLMVGSPSGLSGKYFVGRSTAIDFGVGGIGCCRGRRGLELHADYLWHPLSLASTPAFELPLYLGVGGRYYSYSWRHGDHYHDGSALGARFPIGIAFDMNRSPFDIFIELALVADVIVDHDPYTDAFDRDGLYVDVDAAVGFRYYFQ